jgi:hypothetical protein
VSPSSISATGTCSVACSELITLPDRRGSWLRPGDHLEDCPANGHRSITDLPPTDSVDTLEADPQPQRRNDWMERDRALILTALLSR